MNLPTETGCTHSAFITAFMLVTAGRSIYKLGSHPIKLVVFFPGNACLIFNPKYSESP